MKFLEKDQDKIQKICEELRSQTLEPAIIEAEKMIAAARADSEEIIKEAHSRSLAIIAAGKKQIEQERAVFNSSLSQTANQCIEALRQMVEEALFNDSLRALLNAEMTDPKVLANLINAIIESINKNGIQTDLNVIIPRTVSPETVNRFLLQHILEKLKKSPIQAGPIEGGIQIKLTDELMTLDISEQALINFFKQYLRKDFRKSIFLSPKEM